MPARGFYSRIEQLADGLKKELRTVDSTAEVSIRVRYESIDLAIDGENIRKGLQEFYYSGEYGGPFNLSFSPRISWFLSLFPREVSLLIPNNIRKGDVTYLANSLISYPPEDSSIGTSMRFTSLHYDLSMILKGKAGNPFEEYFLDDETLKIVTFIDFTDVQKRRFPIGAGPETILYRYILGSVERIKSAINYLNEKAQKQKPL